TATDQRVKAVPARQMAAPNDVPPTDRARREPPRQACLQDARYRRVHSPGFATGSDRPEPSPFCIPLIRSDTAPAFAGRPAKIDRSQPAAGAGAIDRTRPPATGANWQTT